MNFIVSLAHFCEIHGPTSILCTQVTPPTCTTCCPQSMSSSTLVPSTPQQQQQQQQQQQPTPPQSSHSSSINLNKSNPTLNTLGSQGSGLRPNTSHLGHGTATSSASSSNVSTPMETPPPSPRSPVLTSATLATAGGPGYAGPSSSSSTGVSSDTCKNCSMTLPKGLQEKTSSNSTTPMVPTRPVLRTKEAILACTPSGSEDEEETIDGELSHLRVQRQNDDSRQLSSSPSAHSYFHSAPGSDDGTPQGNSANGSSTHTHQLTYISTRAPSVPSRYTTLRQACVRTLSCELIPAQTGPMMFGDPLAGYTITYVFRLPDPKARGGRRSYALLCICPDQKIVVSSWKYVVAAFEGLVHRIKYLAAKKQTEDAQVSPMLNNSFSSITSRGPEGFLRRRPPGESGFGVNQKGLAELVGREELFVEVHMCFVKLLGGLVRRFGCWAGSELGLGAGLGSGLASPALARSRAGSVGSSVGADERLERKAGLGVSTPGTATPNAAALSAARVSEETEAAASVSTMNANGVKYPVSAAPSAGASLARSSGVVGLAPVIAGLSINDSITPRAAVAGATGSSHGEAVEKNGEESTQRNRNAILSH